jgi:hypothetical protein
MIAVLYSFKHFGTASKPGIPISYEYYRIQNYWVFGVFPSPEPFRTKITVVQDVTPYSLAES